MPTYDVILHVNIKLISPWCKSKQLSFFNFKNTNWIEMEHMLAGSLYFNILVLKHQLSNITIQNCSPFLQQTQILV